MFQTPYQESQLVYLRSKFIQQDQKSIDAILKRPYDLEVLVPHVCFMIFDFDHQTNINPSN